MLVLNINRKAYMGSLTMCLHFTLVTLKDQCQGHSDLECFYLISFLIHVCGKLPSVIPTAGVKRSDKVLEPLFFFCYINISNLSELTFVWRVTGSIDKKFGLLRNIVVEVAFSKSFCYVLKKNQEYRKTPKCQKKKKKRKKRGLEILDR